MRLECSQRLVPRANPAVVAAYAVTACVQPAKAARCHGASADVTLRAMTTRWSRSNAASFAEAFARRSVSVRHALVDHPLFTIDAIAELADRLPPESVRRERGHLPLVNSDGYVDVGEGPPSETIQDVERNGFRISLRDIQQAPEYAELINECLDEVDDARRRPRGRDAPPGRVPVHLLAGRDDADALRRRAQLPAAGEGREARQRRGVRGRPGCAQRELDRYIDGVGCDFAAMEAGRRDLPHRSRASASTCRRTCRTGSRRRPASRSRSRSPSSRRSAERAETVYRINRRLRKLHLSPRPPGASEPSTGPRRRSARSWEKLRDARRKLPA